MKRFLVTVTTMTLLMTFASSVAAWQVNITNNCAYRMVIDVAGEHLFTRPIDCHVVVEKGETKPCVLPGAICPVRISAAPGFDAPTGTSPVTGSPLYCNSSAIACCWNVNVEAAPTLSGFGCEIKVK